MGTLNFKRRTIDSEMIRSGLSAIAALEDKPQSRGVNYVVGGIATQSYLPTSCRRPTSDIDLASLRNFSLTDFRDFADPAIQHLNDNGYVVEEKKGRNSFQLIYSLGDEAAIIEFSRRSPANLERISKRLEDEFGRTRMKTIEDRRETYRVCAPEDIAVPKLVRTVNTLIRNPDFLSLMSEDKSGALCDDLVQSWLREIAEQRADAEVHIGDPSLSEYLRTNSDLYDVRVLSEIAGFNEPALRKSLSWWNSFDKDVTVTKKVFDFVLPRLSEG